jgi:hypothetical protein
LGNPAQLSELKAGIASVVIMSLSNYGVLTLANRYFEQITCPLPG